MTAQIKAAWAALLAGVLIGAVCAWIWQGNAWSARLAAAEQLQSEVLAQVATAAADRVQEEQGKRLELERRLQAIDEAGYKEYGNVKAENERLAAELRTATRRLSVRTADPVCGNGVPATTGSAGMADGAGARADLHPAVAAGVVGVTGRADECRVRLGALQEWVMGVSE